MSELVIFITYNGRHKTELHVNPNDTIKSLMSQIFNEYSIAQRNYSRDNFTLTNANTLLNADEDWLGKSIKDAGVEEDDNIDLKDAGSVQWG